MWRQSVLWVDDWGFKRDGEWGGVRVKKKVGYIDLSRLAYIAQVRALEDQVWRGLL